MEPAVACSDTLLRPTISRRHASVPSRLSAHCTHRPACWHVGSALKEQSTGSRRARAADPQAPDADQLRAAQRSTAPPQAAAAASSRQRRTGTPQPPPQQQLQQQRMLHRDLSSGAQERQLSRANSREGQQQAGPGKGRAGDSDARGPAMHDRTAAGALQSKHQGIVISKGVISRSSSGGGGLVKGAQTDDDWADYDDEDMVYAGGRAAAVVPRRASLSRR